MRVRRKKKNRLKLLLPLILIIAAGIGCFCYINSLTYKVCRVEAGVEVSASDFMKNQDSPAFFTEESDPYDSNVPGEYQMVIRSGWFTHKCKLIIQDTIAPVVSAVPMKIEVGELLAAEDFITECSDATEVSVSFTKAPDFSVIGIQEVELQLEDLGGNLTKITTELTISPVYNRVVIEAGDAIPSLNDFMIAGNTGDLLSDMSSIDNRKVQENLIQIQVGDTIYESVLQVKDTVAPDITVQDVNSFTLVPLEAKMFLSLLEDETDVSVSFVSQPDLTKEGEQEILVKAVDEGGNESVASAKLILEADSEPPQITGPSQVIFFIGDTIAYRKLVEVKDNCEEGLELQVDSSQVNLNVEGSYPVNYTAFDLAGNTAELTIELSVRQREHSIDEVNALADQVLARIIKEDMTPLEKVQAIYNYNMSHIGYINHSEKVDWVTSAYEGLAYGKGDCFVYASTAKLLLTRAGITNMDIAKIPAKTSHYWNLVDIGDGWYHFDTTPRTDHPTIFMWTDEQLMEYSNSHNKSHNYDREIYPVVN